MNDRICWDPSLIKKFSSSNHYKLLNQLKNEVKKYPLNNKNKSSTIQIKESKQDTKSKSHISNSKNMSLTNASYQQELNSNKSSVSFNNAKNFSIYNNNNISRKNDSLISESSNAKEDISSPTFKDRLNQIDMK